MTIQLWRPKTRREGAQDYIVKLFVTEELRARARNEISMRKMMVALKESEAKYRGILDAAYDPIIIVGATGAIEFSNKQTKKWFGYEPEELVGKPIEILIPERFHSAHVSDRVRYMKQPVARPMGRALQLSAIRKDGTEFPVEISLTPFHTERGVIVTAFIRDMTEQKRVEDQRRFLLETSWILSETVDYQDRIQKIADLVVPMVADVCVVRIVVGDQLVAKAIAHPESIEPDVLWRLAGNEHILREHALYGAAYVWRTEKSQLIENFNDEIIGQIVSNEDDFKRLRDLDIQSVICAPMLARGKMIGVISFLRRKPARYSENDIAFAELISNRAALAVDNARLFNEAQKAVGLREDVLAIVSHDLKNPLGLIKRFNELIATSISDAEWKNEIGEYAKAIGRSVNQMERLVGDLLDFAKIESGTLSLQTKANQVERLVMDGIEDVHYQAEEKSIEVRNEIQPGLPGVYCDSDRIRQVFSNLLGNAIKFSPKHGEVVVHAHSNGPEVIFSVSDTGPGIPPEDRSHLFERYWKSKETVKPGAGLGLSIAKGIIDGHRGQIWVESEAGRGTTVRFSLPICA